LAASLPHLGAATAINILFIYVFSILGVQLMNGKTSYCSDLTFNTKILCLENGHEWKTPN
jgi:hypothetical protein